MFYQVLGKDRPSLGIRQTEQGETRPARGLGCFDVGRQVNTREDHAVEQGVVSKLHEASIDLFGVLLPQAHFIAPGDLGLEGIEVRFHFLQCRFGTNDEKGRVEPAVSFIEAPLFRCFLGLQMQLLNLIALAADPPAYSQLVLGHLRPLVDRHHEDEHREKAHRQERRQRRLTFRPFPGSLPEGRRPGVRHRPAFQEIPQFIGELPRAGVALGGLFLQAFQADQFQVIRNLRHQLTRRHRVGAADQLQRFLLVGCLERRAPRQHFVKDRSQRVNVGRRPDLIVSAPCLFGGHVHGRADDPAFFDRVGVLIQPFGQAEVADLRRAIGGQQNVRRFQVAVDDVSFVGEIHRPSQRLGQCCRLPSRLRHPLEFVAQVPACQILKGHVRLAVVLIDLVDVHQIRMRAARHRACFGQHALHVRRARRGTSPRVDHLQGHQALQPNVERPVHDAHAPLAKLIENLIAGHRGQKQRSGLAFFLIERLGSLRARRHLAARLAPIRRLRFALGKKGESGRVQRAVVILLGARRVDRRRRLRFARFARGPEDRLNVACRCRKHLDILIRGRLLSQALAIVQLNRQQTA